MIEHTYYCEGQCLGSRHWQVIPRKGERVSLDDQYYRVVEVTWFFGNRKLSGRGLATIDLIPINEENATDTEVGH